MYMADLGVSLKDNHLLSESEFVKYRRFVEIDEPLIRELDAVGLKYLPPIQLKWLLVKTLINEAYRFRSKSAPEDGM